MSILCPTLIILGPQQRSHLLRITKPSRFHRTIRQEYRNTKTDTHRQRSNRHEEDPPACKLRVGKTNTIRQQPTKDLSEGIADVEPRYPTTLFFFLVPHGDDENEDRSYAGLEDT